MIIVADFTVLIYGPPGRIQALLTEEWMRESDGYPSAMRFAEWRRPPRGTKEPLHILRVRQVDCRWCYPDDVWSDSLVPLTERLGERAQHTTPGDTIHFEVVPKTSRGNTAWMTAHHHGMLVREGQSLDPEPDTQRMTRAGVNIAMMGEYGFPDLTRPAGRLGLFGRHRAWVVE